jgi:Family of unknown function (DUF6494)
MRVGQKRFECNLSEEVMNEEALNTSVRKFLKVLGVTAQREIEKAIRQAISEGKLKGTERLTAKATVTLDKVGLSHEVDGDIELD